MQDKNTKISIVIGTRAQLVKAAPVMKEMQDRGIDYRYIWTVQHKETMEDISKNFDLKQPDYVLFPNRVNEAKTMKLMFGWFFSAFLKLFTSRREILPMKNGIVLTHGDTISCWWGALLGKLTGNKVMHLESGLRSFNLFKPFPEEISRLITFRLTDVYACPNEWAMNNLKKYKGIKINTGMNTLYDSVRYAVMNEEKFHPEIPDQKYIVASIHRYEHIFKEEKFLQILDIIENVSKNILVVFVLHPATIKRIEAYGLMNRLESNKNIKLQQRMSYFDFIKLLNHSEFVITDGGSNQEELSYMGIPALVLRDVTERIEGLNENIVLAKFDGDVIEKFVTNYRDYRRPFKEMTVSPSKMIVDWLVENNYKKVDN
ncbi:MAG: UDP-N-acetylglucosamine 2-epimerase [Candidatus Pacearchaeota archaeon]